MKSNGELTVLNLFFLNMVDNILQICKKKIMNKIITFESFKLWNCNIAKTIDIIWE
jgi:hypothetical protein